MLAYYSPRLMSVCSHVCPLMCMDIYTRGHMRIPVPDCDRKKMEIVYSKTVLLLQYVHATSVFIACLWSSLVSLQFIDSLWGEQLKKECTIDTLMTEIRVIFSYVLGTRFISETDFSLFGAICTKLHKNSYYFSNKKQAQGKKERNAWDGGRRRWSGVVGWEDGSACEELGRELPNLHAQRSGRGWCVLSRRYRGGVGLGGV